MFDKLTVYIEVTGGRWEARYWHTDEQRYYRFTGLTGHDAAMKAVRDSGYRVNDCRIIRT